MTRCWRFRVNRKIWAVTLLISLLLSLCEGIGTVYAEKSEKSRFAGNDFEVVFEVKNSWEGGYEAEVTVKNTGEEAIENWRLEFPLQEEIDSIWNAVIDIGILSKTPSIIKTYCRELL